jgi:vesicle-associated membrane protein 7
VLLGKISGEDGKMSYIYDQVIFHYIVENKIIYMCMCDDQNKRRIPFMFLDDVKDKFISMYGHRAQTAIAFSMNDEFGRELQQLMDRHNNSSGDSLSAVNTKLDDVKNVMIQNIEMILERGEKLELLVDKTENLHQQAFKFQKSARNLKSAMIWRRVKLYLLVFFIIAILVWVITVIICGISYDRCK